MHHQDSRWTCQVHTLAGRSLLLSGLALALVGQPGWAQTSMLAEPSSMQEGTESSSSFKPKSIEELNAELQLNTATYPNTDNVQPATSVRDWKAQIEASLVQVTGVQLAETETGLQVVLEADGEIASPITQSQGNTLVLDIPNVRLNLADETMAEQLSPVAGIGVVRVTDLPGDQVRVEIVGTDTLPVAEILAQGQNLVVSVDPGAENANDSELDTEVADGSEEEIEITVTATRTETESQKVPQSIQVIPQEDIENREINDLTEALEIIPGIVPDNNTTVFNDVTVRGFGADFRRNGLRVGAANSFGEQTANIERIEVLKGPASVLYGQGSFGGTINLITKKPTDDPFYKVDAAIGNFDLYRGAVDLSGPLNESGTIKYRLNLAAESADSFVDFIDTQRFSVTPVLSFKIGENTDITFEGEYSRLDTNSYSGLPARGTILDNPNGKIPLNRFIGDPERDDQNIEALRIGYDLEHRFRDSWKLRNSFEFGSRSVGNSVLTGFPINLQADGRTLERVFDDIEAFNFYSYLLDTSVVGNFNTGSVEHELLIGFELFRLDSTGDLSFGDMNPIDVFNPDYSNPVFQTTGVFRSERVNQSLGIYLQDKINLLDNLTLLIGGRFDILGTESTNLEANTTDSQTESEFSPRVGIVYEPIPELSLYASYSRSFVPNFFARNVDGEFFEPQRATQFEIGAKAEINDTIAVTLAYFDITVSNLLTEDPNSPSFQVQTGEQNSRGVELFASGEILPGWSIIGGYTYNDARVTEDNTIPEGNRFFNTPRHAFSLSTNYEIQKGNLKGLGFGLGIFFVGDRAGDLQNSFVVPSYTRTDASIFYNREKFRVALNFRNLFDVDYFNAQSDLRVRPGEPFTVIGSVSFTF